MSAGTPTDPAPGHADRVEAQAADWLARLDGDGWADADAAALAAWLEAATAHGWRSCARSPHGRRPGACRHWAPAGGDRACRPRDLACRPRRPSRATAAGDRRATAGAAPSRTTGARWRLATAAGVVACALFADWPGAIASMSMPPASAPRSAKSRRKPWPTAPARPWPATAGSRCACRAGSAGWTCCAARRFRGRQGSIARPFVVATDGYDVVAVGTVIRCAATSPAAGGGDRGHRAPAVPAAGDAARPRRCRPAVVALVTADGCWCAAWRGGRPPAGLARRHARVRDTRCRRRWPSSTAKTRQLVIGDAGVAAAADRRQFPRRQRRRLRAPAGSRLPGPRRTPGPAHRPAQPLIRATGDFAGRSSSADGAVERPGEPPAMTSHRPLRPCCCRWPVRPRWPRRRRPPPSHRHPAGDLASALDAYSRQSGTQLVYRADQLKGAQQRRRAARSPPGGLDQLLKAAASAPSAMPPARC